MTHEINEPQSSRGQILVVDDEPQILSAFQHEFRREYDVFIAGSAAEAYRVMMDTPIQVIIADQQMPGTTGVELLTKVKHDFPDTVRVLLVGDADTQGVISAVNDAAIFHCVSKPWTAEEIQSAVYEAIKWHTMIVEQRRLSVEMRAANVQMKAIISQFAIELSRVEAGNQALNVQLRSVIDGIPDCVYTKDTEGRFTLNNRAHLALLGLSSPDKAIGKSDGDFFPADVAGRSRADDQVVMQSGQPLLNKWATSSMTSSPSRVSDANLSKSGASCLPRLYKTSCGISSTTWRTVRLNSPSGNCLPATLTRRCSNRCMPICCRTPSSHLLS